MPLPQIKKQIAALFRKAPWLAVIGERLWSLRQARYAVGAVGVVFDGEGRVLLLEHVFHPRHPWGLPGGWVNRREAPGTAVARELREETGLCVEVVQPLLVEVSRLRPDHLELAYLCRLEDHAEISLSGEILSYQWSDPANLPDMFEFHQRAIMSALQARERCA